MLAIFERHARELAAVIIEPLCQGAAGMRVYSPEYLRLLEQLCKEKDVLLIVDEIAVGFGRTGKMFAFQHRDIKPDMICLGKSLAGGYLPISATVVKNKIFETFTDQPKDCTFYHGHTFSGNPIAAAAALETLRIYKQEAIAEQAQQRGSLLKDQMGSFLDLPHVIDVRCLGMIGAVELDDKLWRAQSIRERLLHNGILIRPLGNVVYLMPPLITPEDILTQTVEALYKAVEECS
jgi:adenosylmethionine-8-amino-7-oxononanoate aminotransferase